MLWNKENSQACSEKYYRTHATLIDVVDGGVVVVGLILLHNRASLHSVVLHLWNTITRKYLYFVLCRICSTFVCLYPLGSTGVAKRRRTHAKRSTHVAGWYQNHARKPLVAGWYQNHTRKPLGIKAVGTSKLPAALCGNSLCISKCCAVTACAMASA